jgi:hypothetical protein
MVEVYHNVSVILSLTWIVTFDDIQYQAIASAIIFKHHNLGDGTENREMIVVHWLIESHGSGGLSSYLEFLYGGDLRSSTFGKGSVPRND